MRKYLISTIKNSVSKTKTFIKRFYKTETILVHGHQTNIHSEKYFIFIKTNYVLVPILFIISLLIIENVVPPKSSFTQAHSRNFATEEIVNPIDDLESKDYKYYETFSDIEEESEGFYVSISDSLHPIEPQEKFEAHTQPILNYKYTKTVDLNSEYMFDLVNKHRENIGLHPFEQDDNLCSIAQKRATEVPSELSSGTLHQGIKSMGLNGKVVENAVVINSEDRAFNWWMNSYTHRKSIEGNRKYSCIECSGKSCVQLFSKLLNFYTLNNFSQNKIATISYNNGFSITT